jgi:small membrane protein
VTPFAWVLLALLGFILFVDYTRLRREGRRLLLLEYIVFALGAVLIVFPGISQMLARVGGIGRGADLVIYVLLVLLVREALRARQLQWRDTRRYTEIVRGIALTTVERPVSSTTDRSPVTQDR